MTKKLYRPKLERLEQRQLLTANVWFEGSGQELGMNHDEVELADLDGDGDVDAFLACRSLSGVPSCSETQVLLNNGSGQFSKGWSAKVRRIDEVGLGDFDRDGDLDAFFTKASPEGNQPGEIWMNDGRGAFVDSGQRLANFSRGVDIGDLDGDGDLDAMTGTPGFPGIVWLNDGAGVFSDNGQRLVDWSFRVALGDVDGDGDLDAWFGRGTDSPNHGDRLYFNDGKGNFSDSGQNLNAVSTGDIAFGDLDGDRDLDAYLANGHQRGGNFPDRIWMNDGQGTFTDSGQRLGRSNGRSVKLGDVDGDGDLDAVVANGTTLFGIAKQPNVIWLNDGLGVFTAGQELGNTATTSVALGDIDKDGDLDAFFSNLGDGNQLWLNTQPIAGDANRDGVFNSSDLIVVFQAGEYEDGIAGNSTWAEGDWSGDGEFDTTDLILAFQGGKYSPAAVAGSVSASAAPQRELVSDSHDGSLNANVIDQVYGDANLDGDFNSRDLVQVFQAGKYETAQAADWSAGDWNHDGRFDSQDLIAALQRGTYFLVSAKAAKEVPFKGSLQAVNTFDVQFPTLFVNASGSGNATHLGRFTVTYKEVVNLLVPGSGVGAAHFIAANGDSIFTVTKTLGPPQSPEPDVRFAMVAHTITGGTGRFADATGSFTEERSVNLTTRITSSSFDGTILIPQGK